MAGIGFRLQSVVASGGYVRAASTYVSSVVISAGPWISATLSLSFLGQMSPLNPSERSLLFATITYVFSASLILSYGVQLVVTRYLADHLYLKQTNDFAAVCAGVLCCAAPLFLIASPFLLLAPLEWRYRLMAVTLLVTTSLIWLASAFLSATREYKRIVATFVLGYMLSLVAALGLTRAYGVLGALSGFTVGQAICLALLVGHIYIEFPVNPHISLAYLAYLRKYWDLFLIGFLYACSLWIDNVVYWLSPYSRVIAGTFHLFPPYDAAKLVGFLLTIPAASVFLVHVETRVYTCLSEYLKYVMEKGSLQDIRQGKKNLANAIWTGVATVVKVQCIVALGVTLIASDLAIFSSLPEQWVIYLRIVIIAASVQYVMFTGVLLLLYLDHRMAALQTLSVFVCLSAILTECDVQFHLNSFGTGYLLASVIGVMFVLWRLREGLIRLDYATFMLQPLS